MKFDVCALGELLIDFTENGVSTQGNPILEANPGGAPCNVLAMLQRLGYRTAFIGKVGDDSFGRQLRDAVETVGINTEGLLSDASVPTTLAFVHTLPDGDREFSFYRKPGADLMLREWEIREDLIRNSTIFHYGSLSMTEPGCEAATKKAVELAGQAGVVRSFDPNLRENLWDSLDQARDKIAYGISHCDILKISDNEILWFTGETDFDRAVAVLRKEYRIPLLLLSLGKDGSRAYCGTEEAFVPAYSVNTVETTGAGDTFCGCALGCALKYGWKVLTHDQLSELLSFANAAAALVTERKGALRVMPERTEIEALMRRR